MLSTFSLHHFSKEKKQKLYNKIYEALQPNGLFILGDSTVTTTEQEQDLLDKLEVIRKEQNAAEDEFLHFDTPFTAETEISLMKAAGFASPKLVKNWERTSVITAKKE